MDTSKYRQNIDDFQRRLNQLSQEATRRTYTDRTTGAQRNVRVMIDTTGNRTRRLPGGDDYKRIVWYGQRRYLSACRIFALMDRLKTLENLAPGITVSHTDAYWQSVSGTHDTHACHTCPALLMVNGQLPTLMSSNTGWRHHVINTFADCMLMPKIINDIDGIIDSLEGRSAFRDTVKSLLDTPDKHWSDAARDYRELMREYFAPLSELKHTDDHRIEVLQGFYEGLFLTSANAEIRVFQMNLERSL
ncbi:MAG: hypothetical protein AB8B87_23405 [Granulosicoccus sp.]